LNCLFFVLKEKEELQKVKRQKALSLKPQLITVSKEGSFFVTKRRSPLPSSKTADESVQRGKGGGKGFSRGSGRRERKKLFRYEYKVSRAGKAWKGIKGSRSAGVKANRGQCTEKKKKRKKKRAHPVPWPEEEAGRS